MGEQQGQYHQRSLEEQERYRQQQSLSASIDPSPVAIQDQSPDALSFPTGPSSMNTTDDEETTTLSQETTLTCRAQKTDTQISSIPS